MTMAEFIANPERTAPLAVVLNNSLLFLPLFR